MNRPNPKPLPLHEQVADHIKTARRRKGLTQTQLAAMAGVTQPVIAALESAKGNPTLATINRVCDAVELRLRIQSW